jgi:hypothetical protein
VKTRKCATRMRTHDHTDWAGGRGVRKREREGRSPRRPRRRHRRRLLQAAPSVTSRRLRNRKEEEAAASGKLC